MKINKKNIIVIGLIIIIVFIVFLFFKQDKYNLRYRTYSNHKWTSWKSNGKTSGNIDSKSYINQIQISGSNNIKNKYSYVLYDLKQKKYEYDDLNKKNKQQNITGIKFYTFGTFSKKYSICYRSYNSKDKWLGWVCDNNISGNAKERIEAVQIKVIPKDSSLYDYLEDYHPLKDGNKNFDER